jgi:MFS transporter, PPP family, 3-phenylpropionic acid transporter
MALPSPRLRISEQTVKKIWPFSFYFLYFAGIASFAPYMVLYYQSVGLTGAQIGVLTGITPLVTMFSIPFWTGLADSTNRHRLIMSVAMLVGIAILLIFPYLHTYPRILIVVIVFFAFFTSVVAFSDSATMLMLGERKELYGRIRLGGTLGFGLVATLAGILIEDYGLQIAFWSAAFFFFLSFLISLKLAYGHGIEKETANWKRLPELLKNPHWVIFMVLAFTSGVAFAAWNVYFFPFMEELGAKESAMGLALTIGTIVEIPVMLFVNRLIVRFKSYGLLVFALVFTGLRMLLYAVALTPTFVLFVQILNGVSFPILFVAGVSYADELAPKGMHTTAQGLFNAMVSGIGSATGGFLGGLLLAQIGGRGLFLVVGVAVFFVLIAVTLIRRKLPPEQTTSSTMMPG